MQTELVQFIRETIRARGPQSFAWFMQQALYHPEHGYYSSGRCAIGRHGDYFTNVSVGPVFGQLLAVQFAEIWEHVGKIDNFIIVEQGAHHGEFACDVLEFARTSRPDFFAALRYRIIEQFPVLQDRQSETLAKFEGKIEWRESIDALELFTGLHFSNELLDAMPVHLIVSEETKTGSTNWLEKFVTLNGDEFAFVDQSIGNQKLRDHLEKLPARPASYETEVNLTSLGWIENVSRKLARGYVIIADYGYLRDEFYAPHRSRGTLQVRAQHRLLSSPFDEIGRADITAHVEWTSIAERAEACGLQVKGFTDQHHFITGILSELPRDDLPGDAKTTRALQTVLHPEMLGRTFQVLALAKDGTAAGTAATTEDVDLAGPFAGFKFTREPRSALDLDHPNPC
ncbi:MAG TPA: SAM-dependent methyltransferase [Candidatus Udaeobacter sp.]